MILRRIKIIVGDSNLVLLFEALGECRCLLLHPPPQRLLLLLHVLLDGEAVLLHVLLQLRLVPLYLLLNGLGLLLSGLVLLEANMYSVHLEGQRGHFPFNTL